LIPENFNLAALTLSNAANGCENFGMIKRIGVSILGLTASLSAVGCLYFAPSYKQTVTENLREFFVFHDEKNVHVILQTHLQASGKLPERLAWVIPFPSLPLKYEETDAKVFEELYGILGIDGSLGMRSGGLSRNKHPKPGSAVKAHATQVVGNYKVHPLEIVSDVNPQMTASVLDSWLKQKNFITIPFDLQKPYIKKGATFLAIEMTPNGNTADTKPLHITFEKTGSQFSVPLRMTHDTRVFDIRIYTFGFKKAWKDNDPFWSMHFGDAFNQLSYPQPSFEWHQHNKHITRLIRTQNGEIHAYTLQAFNAEGKLRARQLPSDPTFNWEDTKMKAKIR